MRDSHLFIVPLSPKVKLGFFLAGSASFSSSPEFFVASPNTNGLDTVGDVSLDELSNKVELESGVAPKEELKLKPEFVGTDLSASFAPKIFVPKEKGAFEEANTDFVGVTSLAEALKLNIGLLLKSGALFSFPSDSSPSESSYACKNKRKPTSSTRGELFCMAHTHQHKKNV